MTFTDGAALSATVSMYGQLTCFTGDFDNPYYRVARTRPSPLSPDFDADHVSGLLGQPGVDKLSVKAFLATEQRIPGLGNGVLQDICWTARLHPRRKVGTLDDEARRELLAAVTSVLRAMTDAGGRDTESDLFGQPGGYPTVMSRLHLGDPCPRCGSEIAKQTYRGGTTYFCGGCQTP